MKEKQKHMHTFTIYMWWKNLFFYLTPDILPWKCLSADLESLTLLIVN